jgi:hypothetical protein
LSRLFRSDGMTTAIWKLIPPTEIDIDLICPSQGYVSIQILRDIREGRYKEAYGGDEYPHIVLQNDVYWLEDGHHRYIYDLIRGKKYIQVRVLNNEEWPNGKAPDSESGD